ncbi:MAG: 4-diphosphocytidyl-2-C-methyl-D-erythritol kinase [Mariniblastus sp.]|jgi:4-diphosphocytidyl-2-C-methyl-D-erythritol kinase
MRIHAGDNQLEIAAPAKINLFLELIGKRGDGFHEIETLMTSVSVFDRLRFTRRRASASRLRIQLGGPRRLPAEIDEIPTDERNLILRAIHLVRETAQHELGTTVCEHGFDIELQKNIPSAAGLGGASSDAAAALVAANRMWNLNWSTEKLSGLAARLGSDIPFFLYGGTTVCRGRGELIEPISAPAGIPIVIAKPNVALSTADVFRAVDLSHNASSNSECLRSRLWKFRSPEFGRHLFNRLQQFAEPLTDQIGRLAHEFSRLNCVGHQMSGSGSSYFGVFASRQAAFQATQRLSARLPDVRMFCSQTLRPAVSF